MGEVYLALALVVSGSYRGAAAASSPSRARARTRSWPGYGDRRCSFLVRAMRESPPHPQSHARVSSSSSEPCASLLPILWVHRRCARACRAHSSTARPRPPSPPHSPRAPPHVLEPPCSCSPSCLPSCLPSCPLRRYARPMHPLLSIASLCQTHGSRRKVGRGRKTSVTYQRPPHTYPRGGWPMACTAQNDATTSALVSPARRSRPGTLAQVCPRALV